MCTKSETEGHGHELDPCLRRVVVGSLIVVIPAFLAIELLLVLAVALGLLQLQLAALLTPVAGLLALVMHQARWYLRAPGDGDRESDGD